MCAGHSRHGLSDASGLKNPGEQAGGTETESAQPAPSPSDISSPSPWVPRQATEPLWASPVTGESDDEVCGKHLAQAGGPGRNLCKPTPTSSCRKCPTPVLGVQGPHLSLQLPRKLPVCFAPLSLCSLAGPPWTASCLGRDCLLPINTPSLASQQISQEHHGASSVGAPATPRLDRLPVLGLAPRSRKAQTPSIFSGSAFRDRVTSSAHKGRQEAALPSLVAGTVPARPGRASETSFRRLLPPVTLSCPAGNYADPEQGSPGAGQLLEQPECGGGPQGPLPQACDYCPPPSACSVGRRGVRRV